MNNTITNDFTVTIAGADRKKAGLLARALAVALREDDFQHVDTAAISFGKVSGVTPAQAAGNMRETAKIRVKVATTSPGADEPDDDGPFDEAADKLNARMRQASELLDRLDDTEGTSADAEKLYRMLEEVVAAHAQATIIEPAPVLTFRRRELKMKGQK